MSKKTGKKSVVLPQPDNNSRATASWIPGTTQALDFFSNIPRKPNRRERSSTPTEALSYSEGDAKIPEWFMGFGREVENRERSWTPSSEEVNEANPNGNDFHELDDLDESNEEAEVCKLLTNLELLDY